MNEELIVALCKDSKKEIKYYLLKFTGEHIYEPMVDIISVYRDLEVDYVKVWEGIVSYSQGEDGTPILGTSGSFREPTPSESFILSEQKL
jgi:hypothetical protein